MERPSRKKAGRRDRLTMHPQLCQMYRTGFTRLIQVRQFLDAYLSFKRESDDIGDVKIEEGLDLSVDDLKVATPLQAIEEGVQREKKIQLREKKEKRKAKEAEKEKQKTEKQRKPTEREKEQQKGKPTEKKEKPNLGNQKPDHHQDKKEAEEVPRPSPSETKHDQQAIQPSEGSESKATGTRQFAASLPIYKELLAPVAPLKKQNRTKKMSRRGRKEINTMTVNTAQFDLDERTKDQDPIPVADNEVMLRVMMFHPHNQLKVQEFVVLGSQPLTVLKDRLYCLQDSQFDGATTPSACFFIENKFYNDVRNPRAYKYSDYYVNWVKEEDRFSQPGLAHFEAGSMDITFNELSIRLGSHYLYIHQGSCQHVIMFTDMRMRRKEDNANSVAYPVRIFQSKTRRRKCRVCDLFPASYVTYGDKLTNENPFFFCESCYRPFHYSHEGNLLYSDFSVYNYVHE